MQAVLFFGAQRTAHGGEPGQHLDDQLDLQAKVSRLHDDEVIAGHFGVAMATRARWSRLPLLVIVIAAIVPDIIDFTTAAFRICGSNGLYSHSLPAIAIECVVLGSIAGLSWRSPRAGLTVASMIILHLAADCITGQKVLWAHGPIVGLNLYSHPLADFALEAVVTFTGWRMLRTSPARDPWSSAPVLLAALLAGQAALDIASFALGPLKPNGCPAVTPVQSSIRRDSGRRWSGTVPDVAHRLDIYPAVE